MRGRGQRGVGEETVPSTTERSRLKILDFLFGSFKESVSGSVWLGDQCLRGVALGSLFPFTVTLLFRNCGQFMERGGMFM